MKTKLLIVLLLSLVLNSQAQTGELDWLRGKWSGTGFQTDLNSTWGVDLEYSYSGDILTVNYPTLNCGGHWKLLSVEGKKADFIEMITEGKTRCIDGSRIVITYVDDSNLHITWFSKNITGADAYGVISRKEPEWLNGFWVGKGFQHDGSSMWSVGLNYNAKNNIAYIEYPSIGCEGEWIMIENAGDRLVFEEKITKGITKCVDGSKIVLHKISSKYISVTWLSNKGKKIDAFGTLEKKY